MNDLKQRIAIAEACGWTEIEECTCHNQQLKGFEPNPGQHKKHTPDYLNDLNAMHDAEESITKENRAAWMIELCKITEDSFWSTTRATARKRAEAFLKTIGLWKDS